MCRLLLVSGLLLVSPDDIADCYLLQLAGILQRTALRVAADGDTLVQSFTQNYFKLNFLQAVLGLHLVSILHSQ